NGNAARLGDIHSGYLGLFARTLPPECRKGLDQSRHLRSDDSPDEAIIDNGRGRASCENRHPAKVRDAGNTLEANEVNRATFAGTCVAQLHTESFVITHDLGCER